MCDGIAEELHGIDLGDKRLNRRSLQVMESLAANPEASVKVRDEVRRSKLRTTRSIELSQTPQRAARQADLEVRAITVVVKPPVLSDFLPLLTHLGGDNNRATEAPPGPHPGLMKIWGCRSF